MVSTIPPHAHTASSFSLAHFDLSSFKKTDHFLHITMVAFTVKRERVVRRRRRFVGQIAHRQPAPRRMVGRRALMGELKFFDTIKAQTASNVAGVILDDSLNHIAQGVTESERVGRKCTLKHISIHGIITNNLATALANTFQSLRLIVYLDKQANGATAAVTDILEDVGAQNGYNSFYNLTNQGRFRILMDRKIQMRMPAVAQTGAGTFSTYGLEYTWTLNKALNVPVEFSAAAGAIGEIRSNNIGILAICTGANDEPNVGYTCRVRFSDN